MIEITKEIADALTQADSNKWTATVREDFPARGILQNETVPDERICIHVHDNRFRISCIWPHKHGYGSLAPTRPYDHKGHWYSATCATSRGAGATAKAITKLLVEYRPKLQEVLAAEAARLAAIDERDGMAQGTLDVLGDGYSVRTGKHGWPVVDANYPHCPGLPRFEVEIAGQDSFRFTLETSDLTLSLTILKAIRAWSDQYK